MDSPKQRQGVGPPDPSDVALQPETMLGGERGGAVATALRPAACVATATSGLWCKALVVLTTCLSVTALGAPAALPQASLTWMGSTVSQQRAGDGLVATPGDLPDEPAVQLCEKVLTGSESTPGFFLGGERDVTRGTDAERWSLGMLTATTASPLTAQTSPRWQAGARHGVRLRLGTAAAVTQWLGTGVLATSPQPLQNRDDPSPGSQHPLALGSPCGTGPGSHDAVQVPAATSGDGLGQTAGPGPQSLGPHSPSDAPASSGTLVGSLSQNPSTADHSRGDHVLTLRAAPNFQTVPWSADFRSVSSEPPAVVTAIDLSSGARVVTVEQVPSSVPAPDQPTTSGSSGVQYGAPLAGATSGSCNGQKEEVPSALPTEGTSSWTRKYPDAVQVPSAVTPTVLWDTSPAGTFLQGEAALLVNTVLTKVPGNWSGLLATVLASLPSAALAHDVNHPQVLAPSLPPAEAGGSAVTWGILSDLSPPPTHQTLLMSTKAHLYPAQTRAPSVAGPSVTGVSSAAPDAIPEPGVTKGPCKDGAAIVASPSPRAAGGTRGSLLRSPTQRPPLHPDPFLTTASDNGPTAGQWQDMKVTEKSVLPGQGKEDGHSEPRTAPVGPTGVPAGPSEPTHASSGSASPLSSKSLSPEHSSKAGHHTGTTNLPSTSSLLPSTGAVPVATSQTLGAHAAATPEAQTVSSPFVTSQHLSTGREHLPELRTMGTPCSSGSPPASPSPVQPVHVLPLQFQLLGITYSEALSSRTSESYRELEEEVKLMLKQMLSTYETFLQANVLQFMNGSVVVLGEVLFRGDVPAPTNSHLIRTVVTEASRRRSIFSWQLEPQSVQSSGFSLENLDPEKLTISLAALQLGRDKADSLQRLISEVTWSLSTLYTVRNFTVIQLRNLLGEVEITGDLYLDTITHADVAEVLQALTALANCSVDLTSLSVEGARLDLQVYPLSFLITNRRFTEDLLDPRALEHQKLARHLGDVVSTVLRNHRSFLQVVIRGFLPGSLICYGDVVFQHPAPTSLEVLEALVLSVGPSKALAGSDFEVDPFSLAVGEVTLEPPQPEPGFPQYGVAIMVVCSLCIITAPLVLLMCLKMKRLGWWDRVVLWNRRDLEAGTQTLEMDNQGLWVSSEQGLEDIPVHWESDSL